MRRLLLLSALLLSGCITTTPQMVSYGCHQYKTWMDKAICQDREYQANAHLYWDQGTHQIASFRRLLIEQVQSGQMTNAEADYAFQSRIAESNAAIANSQPIIVQAPAQPIYQPVYQQTETNCQPAIGGGFNCTTAPGGLVQPDLSVFHRVKTYGVP